MKQGIACKHCKSPARFWPCWWPDENDGCFAPPCLVDESNQELNRSAAWQAAGVVICLIVLILAAAALAQ